MVFSVTSWQLLLSIGGILFALISVIFFMRYYLRKQDFSDTEPVIFELTNRNKYIQANTFRYRGAFLKIGLMVSLGFAILAFSWTSGPATLSNNSGVEVLIEDIEMIPPRTKEEPPKPVTPPPTKVEELPEEDFPEEDSIDFVDTQIEDDEFYEYEEVKKPAPKPMPVATPPPMEEEEPEIFIFAEEMPSLKTCKDAGSRSARWSCSQLEMLRYVNSQIRYPPIARENGIAGTVVVSFVIDEKGSLTDVNLVRSLEGGCGDEVMRIIGKMQKKLKWSPGRQQGRPVKVRVNLPVKFKLQ